MRRVTGIAALAVSGALAAGLATPASASVTAHHQPARWVTACEAVYHYHHVNAIDYGGIHAAEAERAWYHAAHLALYAGPDLGGVIMHYLREGDGWSWVAFACGRVLNGD